MIETATDVCSAAISRDGAIISAERIDEPRQQASRLAPLIQKVLQESGLTAKELAAVAVSSGPGSYTGLRTGVSTAKGICFGAGVPLIGIDTLTVSAYGVLDRATEPDTLIVPMIDARRMEVYTACFDHNGQRLTEIEAKVLEPGTFAPMFEKYSRLIFTGDGASKYESVLPEEFRSRSLFVPRNPDAADMVLPATAALKEKRLEDVAYFEPFYLKEFIAASPSKKIEAVLHPDS